jgi:hypothetical protein
MYTLLRDFLKSISFGRYPGFGPFVLLLRVTFRKWWWSVGSENDKLKPKKWEKNLFSCHTIHHESLRASVVCNNSFSSLQRTKTSLLNAIYGNNLGLL